MQFQNLALRREPVGHLIVQGPLALEASEAAPVVEAGLGRPLLGLENLEKYEISKCALNLYFSYNCPK
jgi:hypothetical protein